MGKSYPDRTNATGLWKLSDITRNKLSQGTWPGSFGDRAIFMGGNSDAASNMQEIDTVQITTAGNSTDFGDLTAAKFNGGAIGNNSRGIHSGGRTPTILNVIEYIHFASTGNAADFGDLTSARLDVKSINNRTRGVTGSGATPGNSNVMDFITIQTLGNAIDFGDLTVARSRTSATQSPTRGVWGGGFVDGSPATYSNVMDFIEISSAGNAVDFGDMLGSVSYSAAFASQVSGMWGGGRTPGTTNTTTINKINFGSLGNATDFGNLRTARGGPGDATSNRTKGIYAGGENPSGGTWLDEIETESLTSSGTGVDFGDLSRAKSALAAVSQAHGGLAEFFPRPSATYMPGSGRALSFGGGTPTLLNAIDLINIPTKGNAIDFGDLLLGTASGGSNSSLTRAIYAGGQQPGASNTIMGIEMASLGNAFDFGNLTRSSNHVGGAASSTTRGLFQGGDPSTDIIDYITIATAGDAADFGNLSVAKYYAKAISNITRGVIAGGNNGSAKLNVIEYVTIASTGNVTDFGDLGAARENVMGGNVSSSTRGVFGGGEEGDIVNIIEYITIASTGNATDFGDLTAARDYGMAASNSVKGIFGGGYAPGNSNVIDFITIASTGNAADHGDLTAAKKRPAGVSDSHGGLQG